jgi:hypothetical protein
MIYHIILIERLCLAIVFTTNCISFPGLQVCYSALMQGAYKGSAENGSQQFLKLDPNWIRRVPGPGKKRKNKKNITARGHD